MKRVVLSVVFGLLVVGMVFGEGHRETDENNESITVNRGDNMVNDYTVNIGYNMGETTATIIVPQDDEMNYVIIKKQIDDDIIYQRYHEDKLKIITGVLEAQVEEIFSQVNVDPDKYIVSGLEDRPTVIFARYGEGTVSSEPFDTISQEIPINNRQIPCAWEKFGTEILYELLFLNNERKYELLRFKIQPEFFAGERTLFRNNALNQYNYQQKAAAFMSTFFSDNNEKNDFKSVVAESKLIGEIKTTDPFWNMFNDPDSLGITENEFERYKDSFCTAMAQHFKYDYDELVNTVDGGNGQVFKMPYLSFERGTFDNIYGKIRNIYISAYLYYIFEKKSKPILSKIIEDSVKNNGQTVFPYNYENYRMIDFGEGDELAKMALRYLTGGVEYTPQSAHSYFSSSNAKNEVFENYYDMIKEWVTVKNQNRKKNYLPNLEQDFAKINFPTDEMEKPKEVQILKGGFYANRLQLKGKLEPGKSNKLSRIDVWTSHNIIWEPGIVANILIEGGKGDYTDDLLKMKDKAIFGGGQVSQDVIDYHTIHIVRDGTNPIIVGYEFTEPQKVKALLLVRGCADIEGSISYNKSCIGLEVKYENGTTQQLWNEGAETKFVEYVSMPWDDGIKLDYYYQTWAGKGVRLSKYTKDVLNDESPINEHVVYSYIVLKDEIENCKEIKLIDKTGNDFLNVAELMVFPGNPVDYGVEATDDNNYMIQYLKMYIYRPGELIKLMTEQEVQLLRNYNFTNKIDFGDIDEINIFFAKTIWVDTIVIWENGYAPDQESDTFADKFNFRHGIGLDLTEEYFSDFDEERQKEIISGIRDLLFTPFAKIVGLPPFGILETSCGNPLPFAPKGIDSPRTFAYKMWEQFRARKWLASKAIPYYDYNYTDEITTLAKAPYNEGYVNEIDIFHYRGVDLDIGRSFYYGVKYSNVNQVLTADGIWQEDLLKYITNEETLKPFLPGLVLNNREGSINIANSLYSPDKVAGVNSVGLLMGSLAMSGFAMTENGEGNVLGIKNTNVDLLANLNKYYCMDEENKPAKGLDAEGKPVFYAGNYNTNSIYHYRDELFRFRRSDLERCTVLVPDISQIQKGDLLIRYDGYGEPHIGIVVGFTWDSTPAAGSDAREWMEHIIVITISRGFETATIGTWGSPEGLFGGFSTDPDEYQIRRLVVLKNGVERDNLQAKADTDEWEMVKEVALKVNKVYPNRDYCPSSVYPDGLNTVNEITAAAQNNIGLRFYREYPLSSITKKANCSIFGGHDMIVYCMSGWGHYKSAYDDDDGNIRYHEGIDLHSTENKNNYPNRAVDGEGWPLFAPEDGIFWIYKSQEYNHVHKIDGNRIMIPDGEDGTEYLRVQFYPEEWYGFVGVLVTNPVNPKRGKIYIFAHLGPTVENYDQNNNELPYSEHYTDPNNGNGIVYERYPGGMENAIYVKAGNWIGYTGTRGNSSDIHIHFEVYEHFEQRMGNDTGGWEKVDPLSCFHKDLYTSYDNGEENNTYAWWREEGSWDDFDGFDPDTSNVNMKITYDFNDHYGTSIGYWVSVEHYDGFIDDNLFHRIFIMEEDE